MKDDYVTNYLQSTLPDKNDLIIEMEAFAKKHQVPIMEPISIEFVKQILRIKQPKRILEIGTAIGYSALRMLEASPESHIVTVERDSDRYQEAITNIHRANKKERIDVIFGDALEISDEVEAKGPYDVLFIDAAKGQYQKFFTLYEKFVLNGGLVITDNVLFKGYVASNPDDNSRMKKIGNKIRGFNNWLIQQPNFDTSIFPIGDGVALSVKKDK
ncbi:Predicted O-methyltransferase YrrM [Salinibacillus kushneri]|uniref:tRNA 5-hydroxyuridine methyltransferase n=1 Tax=Salinibacillus kushneri TaxID=237682 RepID=A0A1I0G5B9_9BACI|nr:O-methyltransferase [Salinibacillus kushneri]SET66112.1 Predicted O-methyltransferase YrrM [Salinibacillus kushneri]